MQYPKKLDTIWGIFFIQKKINDNYRFRLLSVESVKKKDKPDLN